MVRILIGVSMYTIVALADPPVEDASNVHPLLCNVRAAH